MAIIDVQAKRRYAQQRAIIDKYTPYINQQTGVWIVSDANAREQMERELREIESQWED